MSESDDRLNATDDELETLDAMEKIIDMIFDETPVRVLRADAFVYGLLFVARHIAVVNKMEAARFKRSIYLLADGFGDAEIEHSLRIAKTKARHNGS